MLATVGVAAHCVLQRRGCGEWLAPLLNGVEHANFFETRATEYSKAATTGNWNDVWSNFDQRRKAKAGDAANEGGADAGAGEPDMFGEGAVAAE